MSHRPFHAARQPWLAATLVLLLVLCPWSTPSRGALPATVRIEVGPQPAPIQLPIDR